jgi:hypothetical protein
MDIEGKVVRSRPFWAFQMWVVASLPSAEADAIYFPFGDQETAQIGIV